MSQLEAVRAQAKAQGVELDDVSVAFTLGYIAGQKGPSFMSGACYCGAVTVKAKGAPEAVAICHCNECRKWSGSAGQLVTLFKAENVAVEGELVEFKHPSATTAVNDGKKNNSIRRCCAKCFGCVTNDGQGAWDGLRDICGGILGDAKWAPTMHLNYPSGVVEIKDGLPKFKDFPAGFGGSDEKVAEARSFPAAPALHEGACYCGAVTVKATGAPEAVAVCHCNECRKWSGSLGQLVTLFKAENVAVKGELVEFKHPSATTAVNDGKKNNSIRRCCAKCFGCVTNDGQGAWDGLRDICGGILGDAKWAPTMHLNYPSSVVCFKDGLPKFKDFPAGFGGSDEKVAE